MEMIRILQALRPLTFRTMMCCALAWRSLCAQEVPTRLNLIVVQGEGAANRAGERALESPAVRVEDQNNQPISNAAVVFTLPTSGPTGDFEEGGKTATVLSDARGVAAVRGLKLNDVTGRLQILVNVAYRGQTASTVITEFTTAPNGVVAHHGSHGKLIAIVALAAGGAAGAIFATRKSSSSSTPGGGGSGSGSGTPSTIVLTIGSSSVGAPH
jgi:hypothetical protein